jgi:hypothetical protein
MLAALSLVMIVQPFQPAIGMMGFYPEITIISPAEGEAINANSNYNIVWDNSLEGGYEYVTINYRTSADGDWQPIVANYYTGHGGTHSYAWTVPNQNTDNAMIRIQGDPNAGGDPHYFYSGTFKIINAIDVTPKLTITYPNGGETILWGRFSKVLWQSKNIDKNQLVKVEIGYRMNNGPVVWRPIGFSPNDGELIWFVTGPYNVTALARVSLVSKPVINDVSDNFFKIVRR